MDFTVEEEDFVVGLAGIWNINLIEDCRPGASL